MEATLDRKVTPPPLLRWTALVLMSLVMFAAYYIYDSINPITDILKTQLDFSEKQIGLMGTSYSIASLVALILGGFFIDKYGTKLAIIIFSILVTSAAVLTAATTDVSVMLAGRALLGFASEPLIVAITTALAKWFKGKELSFAFAINLLLARLGSFAADTSPTWGSSFFADPTGNPTGPLYLAAMISVLCIVGALIYWMTEKYGENKSMLKPAEKSEKIQLKGMFTYGKAFWFIVLLCVTYYSAVFPFRLFAVKLFQHVQGISLEEAGNLNSILPLSAMIATPIFGLIADKFGKRATMMLVGAVLIAPVFLMIAYTNISLYVPIAMMGVAFSLIPAVMWPSVAYLVEEKRLGSAYAIMTMIQQIGVALFNYVIGWANDYSNASATNPEGYGLGMWMFSILGISALVFAILLKRHEAGPDNHGLEKGME